MAKRLDNPSYEARTVLGRETRFKGVLRFQESLKISGYFEGIIETPGILVIDANAVVHADITTKILVVGGTLKGNVHAKDRLIVLKNGCIIGNIRCPNLVVAEGTTLQGLCEMLVDPTTIDVFSMTTESLKKTISLVN